MTDSITHVSPFGNGHVEIGIDGYHYVLDETEAARLVENVNEVLDE